jgi:hypothetical protein
MVWQDRPFVARHASSSTQGAPLATPDRRAQVPHVTAHAWAAVTRASLRVVAHWSQRIRAQGVPVVRASQLGSSMQTSSSAAVEFDSGASSGCCSCVEHSCSHPATIVSALAIEILPLMDQHVLRWCPTRPKGMGPAMHGRRPRRSHPVHGARRPRWGHARPPARATPRVHSCPRYDREAWRPSSLGRILLHGRGILS